jgi:hypothetical protein
VLPAHALASRARGALLLHSSVPDWPAGLPLQLHVMSGDAWGDVEVGRELAAAGAELFEYPGDRHLFTDAGLDAYDKAATALVVERARAFIADLG